MVNLPPDYLLFPALSSIKNMEERGKFDLYNNAQLYYFVIKEE